MRASQGKISEAQNESDDNQSNSNSDEQEEEEKQDIQAKSPDKFKSRASIANLPRFLQKRKSTIRKNDLYNVDKFIQSQQFQVEWDTLDLKKSKANQSVVEEYNFYMHEKKFSFGKNSLFIFDESNLLRKYCVWLVTWHWFDKVIVFIIILNTISLMMQNYDFRVNGTSNQSTLTNVRNQMEYFFTGAFLMEFVLKVIAMGFILEPSTYLRDGWNVLDFSVVISSILSLIGSINLSAIRTIRILRPLRSIKSIPGLRILVASLLDSLPHLGNVVFFLLYILVIFGILGVQLFSGAYESRCRLTERAVNGVWEANPNITILCMSNEDCPAGNYCGNPSEYDVPQQPDNFSLIERYGSFDDILKATFTIFQSLTTEGWSSFTYMLSEAVTPAIVYVYFITLTLLGSFFTVNLILAVINDSFLKNQYERKQEIFKEEQLRKLQKKEKKLKAKKNAKVHPEQNVGLVVETEESDSDDEHKKKKEALIKRVLQPAKYLGRAEFLKTLQDQYNAKQKGKKQTNFFDPTLFTLDVESKEGKTFSAKVQEYAKEFIDSLFFLILVNLFILANTVVLAMDRYPQPADEDEITNYINLGFTVFFVFELVIKLYALGFKDYFRDSMNVFDCLIVIISMVEQILDLTNNSVSGGSFTAVSAFRTLRIFRIFKLARSWTSFREILIAIASTLEAIGLFTILLLLFMIISSLVGMELFAYNVFGLRLNFDSFFESMITIFTLLTNESWNLTTYDYIYQINSWWPLIFFVIVVLFGNFILLKLFIAILIYNFGQQSIEAQKKLEEKAKKNFNFMDMISQLKSSVHNTEHEHHDTHEHHDHNDEQKEKKHKKLNLNYVGQHYNSDVACFFLAKYDEARFEARRDRIQKKMVQRFFETAKVVNQDEISDDSSDDEQLQQSIENRFNNKVSSSNNNSFHQSLTSNMINSQTTDKKSIFDQKDSTRAIEIIESQMLTGNSLYLFSKENRFRKLVFRFINHPQVVGFIILLILVSSVLLAMEDPLTPSDNIVLQDLDLAITICFIAEALLKIISLGFLFNGQYSYLRDSANILDFLVIIFSIISVVTTANLQIFKILRVFRVLRPLRLISRNDSLKIAINALILSTSKLFNLLLVCLVFYLLFGIFGVNFFKGSFYKCDLVGNFTIVTMNDCLDYGGNWVNADYNFDNVLNAMQGLFVISTTEGWIDQMFQGIDAVGINLQPIQNYNYYWSLFYVFFVIIGSFFVQNLFAGVVLDAFNTEKEKLRGYFYLTLEQQEWVDIRDKIYWSKPVYKFRPYKNKYRALIFRLVSHRYFDQFVFALILLNTIIFMIQFTRQPQELTIFISYSNLAFLALFTLELILKLIALGNKYFYESFNIFDFIVVILTGAGAILEQMNLFTSVGTAISVLRSFRIIRILRLVRSAKSLRIIFETFLITIPELAIIGGLLSIILFMYSVLGLNLYAYIKRNVGITFQANFSSLLSSLFLLFKCSTGESWDQVMADLMRTQSPNFTCFSEVTYDDFATYGFQGCGDFTGSLFMISFQFLFSMIMLNLFVAVIVSGYDKIQKDEQSLVSSYQIAAFIDHWKQFDQDATGLIKALDLPKFLIKLPRPLGWKGLLLTDRTKRKIINEYKLPAYQGDGCYYYYFYDVLQILSHGVLQRKYGDDTELEPKKQVKATKDLIKRRLNLIEHLKDVTTTNLSSEDINAAYIIMKVMKEFVREIRIRGDDVDIQDLNEVKSEDEQDEYGRPASSNLQTQGQMSAHQLNQTTHTRITSSYKK